MSGCGALRLWGGVLLLLATILAGCTPMPVDPRLSMQPKDVIFCPPSRPEQIATLIDQAQSAVDGTVYGFTDKVVVGGAREEESTVFRLRVGRASRSR